jgi:hypothetical protein
MDLAMHGPLRYQTGNNQNSYRRVGLRIAADCNFKYGNDTVHTVSPP